jgi:hypothetical protein
VGSPARTWLATQGVTRATLHAQRGVLTAGSCRNMKLTGCGPRLLLLAFDQFFLMAAEQPRKPHGDGSLLPVPALVAVSQAWVWRGAVVDPGWVHSMFHGLAR